MTLVANSVIPSPHFIVHIPRDIETGDIDPATGNPMIAPQPPVVRKVMAIVQFGRRGSSRQVMSGEFLDRTQTDLHMATAEPEKFHPLDQVIINPEFTRCGNRPTAADWIPDTGTAFFVDGDPADARVGPWRVYLKQFGGAVKLRRVT